MTLRYGLIARGNNRGLGIICQEWARNLPPDRTLIVQPDSAHDAGLQLHSEWFDPDALHTRFFRELDEAQCRAFMDGLDVVLSFESYYDWRFCDWARDMGVRTVCMAMPEYFKHTPNPYNRFAYDLPAPDRWWAPTCWRLDHLPPGTRVVPIPIALDRFSKFWPTLHNGPPRWLHVVGSRAAADRNGTLIFVEALRHLKQEHQVIIRSQGDPIFPNGRAGRKVHVESHSTDLTDWWDLYGDTATEPPHALVLPRRYGGLSMPALEAMGAGLALVMPDVEPQASEWPIVGLPAEFPNFITTSAGSIPICAVDPTELATKMDWLAAHPASIRGAQRDAQNYAQAHSWEALRPTIVDELERACA